MLIDEAKTQIGLHTLFHVNVFSAILNLGWWSSGRYVCLACREQMYRKQSYIIMRRF